MILAKLVYQKKVFFLLSLWQAVGAKEFWCNCLVCWGDVWSFSSSPSSSFYHFSSFHYIHFFHYLHSPTVVRWLGLVCQSSAAADLPATSNSACFSFLKVERFAVLAFASAWVSLQQIKLSICVPTSFRLPQSSVQNVKDRILQNVPSVQSYKDLEWQDFHALDEVDEVVWELLFD